ncbi:MAG: PEP-CTERM sorting domain-containing protein [Phycisphaerae bacterium]|nr:PEP-CTERM sorting domain-containing protein [Phycisphaerae bacterium]
MEGWQEAIFCEKEMKMRTLAILTALVALVAAPAARAEVILAGFETSDADATIEAVGFDGVAAGGVGWTHTTNASQSDDDGTFGTLAGASTTDSSWKYSSSSVSLVDPFYVDFTLTNNSNSDYDLEYFRFDAGRRGGDSAPNWSVDVQAGSDITVGNVGSGVLSAPVDPVAYDDLDLSLTALADHTLEAGESATVRVSFSGGIGNSAVTGPNNYIDNVAFTGTPEPATMALMVFGGLTVLSRRRRRA